MRFVWLAGIAIGAVAGLFVTSTLDISLTDEKLRARAHGLISRATAVAIDTQSTLGAINEHNAVACSPSDLQALRSIVYASPYLRDVGRAEGGEVICTAIWGRLPKPLTLPPADRVTRSGISLWVGRGVVPDVILKSDMAMEDSAITYTIKSVFQEYENPPPGSRSLLVTHDGTYVFRSFGDNADSLRQLIGQDNKVFGSGERHFQECSNQFRACAIVQADLSVPNFWNSPATRLVALLVGGLSGGGIGYAVLQGIRTRRTMAKQLKRALRRRQIRVAYQPIVELGSNKLVGVEALARWNDEYGRPVSPEVFVSLLEKMGSLEALTRHIVSVVLAELREYLTNPFDFYVSINVGVSDLVSEGFQEHLSQELRRNCIEPSRVALEITERASSGMDQMATAVASLRARGYKIFIDDFGTGYSGLAYLANMPVDIVKVDKMFSSAVGTNSLQARMLEKICGIISDADCGILFEGVETEAQRILLRELCPSATGQGWLFGKPAEGTNVLGSMFVPNQRGCEEPHG